MKEEKEFDSEILVPIFIVLAFGMMSFGLVFFNDVDLDKITDYKDNCRNSVNTEQQDSDGDKIGDVCDNCPYHSNPNQTDSDADKIGDVCDLTIADPQKDHSDQ